jgi:transposase
MKAYSIDLREKIVSAYFLDNLSIRKTAEQFSVAKSFVQKLVKQQKNERTLEPKKPGKPQISYLTNAESELRAVVAENHDATLAELCEFFAEKTGNWVGKSAMCSALQRLGLNRKKKPCVVVKGKRKESKI